MAFISLVIFDLLGDFIRDYYLRTEMQRSKMHMIIGVGDSRVINARALPHEKKYANSGK